MQAAIHSNMTMTDGTVPQLLNRSNPMKCGGGSVNHEIVFGTEKYWEN